jgi:hypothetical protein
MLTSGQGKKATAQDELFKKLAATFIDEKSVSAIHGRQ